jgi:hypothetical protein
LAISRNQNFIQIPPDESNDCAPRPASPDLTAAECPDSIQRFISGQSMALSMAHMFRSVILPQNADLWKNQQQVHLSKHKQHLPAFGEVTVWLFPLRIKI